MCLRNQVHFFLGLSLALWSHDEFQASHWSSPSTSIFFSSNRPPQKNQPPHLQFFLDPITIFVLNGKKKLPSHKKNDISPKKQKYWLPPPIFFWTHSIKIISNAKKNLTCWPNHHIFFISWKKKKNCPSPTKKMLDQLKKNGPKKS